MRDAFSTSDDEERNNVDEWANRSGRYNNLDVEQLFVDIEKSLFTGCEDFPVLSFLLRTMHVMVTYKITNMTTDMLLQLLNEAFKFVNFLESYYEGEKYMYSLALGHESIHTFENDYALFCENEDM